jgi:competence protein ComEA
MKKTILSLLLALTLSFSAFAAVNINTASKAELQTLTGIGAKKASAIIKYRTEHGKFKSVNDLSGVKGIGPKMVKKIGKDAAVSGKTTVASKVKSKKKTTKAKTK